MEPYATETSEQEFIPSRRPLQEEGQNGALILENRIFRRSQEFAISYQFGSKGHRWYEVCGDF